MGSEEILVPTATSHQTNQHDLHHPERQKSSGKKKLFFPSSVHFLANLPLIQAKNQVFKKIGIYETSSNRHNQKKNSKRELQPITYHLSLSNPSPVFPLSFFQKASNAGPPGIMTTWPENCTKKKGIKTEDGFFFLSLSLFPSLYTKPSIHLSRITWRCLKTKKQEGKGQEK